MNKYIKNIMLFLISSLIITLVFSSAVQGSNNVLSVSKDVYLTDKAVEKEVVIYNFLNEATEVTLKLNTYPFPSQLLDEKVFLSANEVKKIRYTINPLKDSLDVTYTASLEVFFPNNRFVEYFTINQAFNKECDLDLDLSVTSIEGNSKEILFIFKNENDFSSQVIIKNIIGVDDFSEKKIVVEKNSEFEYNFVTLLSDNEVTVEYLCNNVLLKETTEVKKDGYLTGFSTLNFVDDVINSVYFKIILIVLLIVLVLSFATRYLRHINKK